MGASPSSLRDTTRSLSLSLSHTHTYRQFIPTYDSPLLFPPSPPLLTLSSPSHQADGVLIPEPLPGLTSAQLGVMWLTVDVRGRPAHVLNTGKGFNAIEAAFSLYSSLKELEEKWNSEELR